MRIPSGKTDIYLYFVAVDSTDLKTRETALSSFTVQRSRNGAAEVAYTTPTITEIDATNMPGVYALLVDEDTTIASGSDSEEYCVHITQASMAPVTRTIELYRRDTTSGRTIVVDASGLADANMVKAGPTGSGTAQTAGDIIGDTNDIQTRLPVALVGGRMDSSVGAMAANVMTAAAAAADLTTELQSGLATAAALDTVDNFLDTEIAAIITTLGTPAGASVSADIAAAKADTAAIKLKTDNLPSDPADESLVIAATDALAALINGLNDITADDVWDKQVDGTVTARESMRLQNSALGGKLSGAATVTNTIRDLADTKDRIVATVDADGNRTAMTRDLA